LAVQAKRQPRRERRERREQRRERRERREQRREQRRERARRKQEWFLVSALQFCFFSSPLRGSDVAHSRDAVLPCFWV